MTERTAVATGSNVTTRVTEKIAYGMGDVACNVVFALTSGLVVYFYTNVMQIPAGLVGGILLVSRILDGISDVAIGVVMDRVNSHLGKGRAWVLWMAVPYAVTAVALFCVPANAILPIQGLYIFITYNLCTTVVYTALNLPYAAMAPLLTSNRRDLAVINICRMALSPIGSMVVSAATLPLIRYMGGAQAAWIKVTAIYSVISLALLLWCFFGTKERVSTAAARKAEKLPLRIRFSAILHNRYFYILLLASCFLSLYQTISGTCGTYYAQYVLGNSEWYGALQIAENLPQIVTILLLPVLLRFGKRNLVLAGALLAIAANLMLAVMPDNSTMALASCVLRGVGKAPFFGFIFTMTADVVNYGHWKTGIRVESMIFSSKTAGQKFGGGVAGWLVGCLMDASGFTGLAKEIPSAVEMVKGLYIYGNILAWAAIAVLMWLYRLDREYDGIIEELKRRGQLAEAD